MAVTIKGFASDWSVPEPAKAGLDAVTAALMADAASSTGTAVASKVASAVAADATVAQAAADAVSTELVGRSLTSNEAVDSGASAEWYDEAGELLFAIDGLGTGTPSLRGSQSGSGGTSAGVVLTPSGDTTGATDTSAVNQALASNPLVVLAPGQWHQNGAYVIPSDTRLHCEGPFESTLVAGANSNNVTNDISETTCTNVALTGSGHVRFDGNAAQQTRLDLAPNYAGWKNVGIHFVNVDGLYVNGITWANTAMFGALCTGVRNAYWLNNRVEQDFAQPNQDGLDIGPGCSFIYIDGLTGNTEDDVHSIFGKYNTSQKTVHPLYLPAGAQYTGSPAGALYSAEGNSTHDIYVTRSHVNAGKNFFRLQAAEGSKLYNIFGSDIRHTGTANTRCLVILGEMLDAYIDAPPASDGSDFYGLKFTDFTGAVDCLVYADSHFRDLTVEDARLTEWGGLLGEKNSTDTPPNFSRVTLRGITSDKAQPAGSGNIFNTYTGTTATDVSFEGLNLRSAARLVYGYGSLTNIRFQGYVGSFSRQVFENFTSSGTGWVNVKTGAAPAATGILPATPAGSTTITNGGA